MKQYSIKTVDGSRFDWVSEKGIYLIQDLNSSNMTRFFGLPITDKETKWFNVSNVVSITEKEVEA